MINHEHYTYQVIWSEGDREFVGLCSEFPSLSHLDETSIAALRGIMNLVKGVVAEMESDRESVPSRASAQYLVYENVNKKSI
jgi:hypothetical protein